MCTSTNNRMNEWNFAEFQSELFVPCAKYLFISILGSMHICMFSPNRHAKVVNVVRVIFFQSTKYLGWNVANDALRLRLPFGGFEMGYSKLSNYRNSHFTVIRRIIAYERTRKLISKFVNTLIFWSVLSKSQLNVLSFCSVNQIKHWANGKLTVRRQVILVDGAVSLTFV